MQHFIESGMSYDERFRTRLGQQLSKIEQHDLVVTPFPSVNFSQKCIIIRSESEVEDLGTDPNC